MEGHEGERLCGKWRVACGLYSYNLRDVFTWHLLKTVVMGQVLSLLICGTAVSCQYLVDAKVETPMLQSFLNYALLLLFYTTILVARKGERNIVQILKTKWWKYLVMGLADVQANYAVVKAYQFTTLTSIQLLDCFVIPVLMLLSWFFLKTRYRPVHFVAVTVCLLGVGAMVGADILAGRDQGSTSDVVLGDGLVLLSAGLYAVSNVCQEHTVKNRSRVEFLGMMGLFGTLISGIQLVALETSAVAAIKWDVRISTLFAVYALCMYALYSFMPVVVKMTSATAVNLSLLTADLFSLFCGLFLFHYKVSVTTLLLSGTWSRPSDFSVWSEGSSDHGPDQRTRIQSDQKRWSGSGSTMNHGWVHYSSVKLIFWDGSNFGTNYRKLRQLVAIIEEEK
uniref:Solute carrier family 35 member F2 n=1 Tax=Scophthalmus maximus TaxID=52904 RepID=A0A8D3DCY3_SCOMX